MSGLAFIAGARAPETHTDSFAEHKIRSMPVVLIALHEGCNCRCVMCDIWKIREPREIAIDNLERQLDSFEKLGVRWVAFTGGEPQRHGHFGEFSAALKMRDIRITMLTAGVLLEGDARLVAESVDDVIVSLDGPPEIHDQIRRVPEAFNKLAGGIHALRNTRPGIPIAARCTVQRANYHVLCRTVECAKGIGLDSISFLAADVSSQAFNRSTSWSPARQNAVALDERQVDRLEEEIERLITTYKDDNFVIEKDEKLRRIVLHFRAHLGQKPAVAPRCNAPWVSAVIEAGGEVRPCFFHAPVGSIQQHTFAEIVNGAEAIRFRSSLEVAADPTCRRCVCSLYMPQGWEPEFGRSASLAENRNRSHDGNGHASDQEPKGTNYELQHVEIPSPNSHDCVFVRLPSRDVRGTRGA